MCDLVLSRPCHVLGVFDSTLILVKSSYLAFYQAYRRMNALIWSIKKARRMWRQNSNESTMMISMDRIGIMDDTSYNSILWLISTMFTMDNLSVQMACPIPAAIRNISLNISLLDEECCLLLNKYLAISTFNQKKETHFILERLMVQKSRCVEIQNVWLLTCRNS